MDVPERQRAFRETLSRLGFEQGAAQPLMLLGAAAVPGRRDAVRAVTSPAFG